MGKKKGIHGKNRIRPQRSVRDAYASESDPSWQTRKSSQRAMASSLLFPQMSLRRGFRLFMLFLVPQPEPTL
ncbi:MAG: hypothetical protein EAZ81_01870 [Verrucomicrobia bacterium]|nr:MAG: hypothetical protein EAZ81_01870 [Verrucomicrobiota bacterium]